MIVDSSALVAIARQEEGFRELVTKLRLSAHRGMGAPTLAETALVLTGRTNEHSVGAAARLVQELRIEILLFGEEHWKVTADAFYRYGKGRHRARLNFGDCMTYAVAKIANEPLLFIGNDFALTDIEIA